jgi:Ca2+-binding RTX toxin-like protein
MLIVVVALVVAAALHVGGAGAAVVNMTQSGNLGRVEFTASPGETNNLTVTSCGPGCVDLMDSGANISGGWGVFQSYGCFSGQASGLNGLFGARCTHPNGINVVAAVLDDMNDMIVLSLPSSTTTVIGGGSGNDALVGGPSIDNLYGATGDDTLSAAGNCDNIEGGPGMDKLDGGAGPDMIWGDSGADTVDYSSRSAHVFVALDMPAYSANCTGAPFGNDGELGEGDNVDLSVENVTGGSANDSLFGSSAANVLSGGDGDDLLDGAAGADLLAGGSGFDTADYSSRSTPVTVTFDETENDGTAGESDNVLTDIERVNGGGGNDTLVGDQRANEFHGNGGDDTLSGNGGIDLLFGEGDNDTLNAHDMDVDDTMDCGTGTDSSTGDAMYPHPRWLPVFDTATGCENPTWIFPLRLGLRAALGDTTPSSHE